MTVLAGEVLFFPENEITDFNSFNEKSLEDLRYFDDFDENEPKEFSYDISINSNKESITVSPNNLINGYDSSLHNQLINENVEMTKNRKFAGEAKKLFQAYHEIPYEELIETIQFRRCMSMVVLARFLERLEALDGRLREKLLIRRGFYLPRQCADEESDDVLPLSYIEKVYEFFLTMIDIYKKHNNSVDRIGIEKIVKDKSIVLTKSQDDLQVAHCKYTYQQSQESRREDYVPMKRTNTFWNGTFCKNPQVVPYKSLLVEAERVLIRITESRTLADGTYLGLLEPRRRLHILKYEACQSLGIFKQPVGLDEALKEVELRKAQIEAFKKQSDYKPLELTVTPPIRTLTAEQRLEQKRLRESFNLGKTDMTKLAAARASIGDTLTSWGISMPKREDNKDAKSSNDDLIEKELKKLLESQEAEKTEKKKMSKKEKAREAKREEERWLNFYKDVTIHEVPPENMGDFIYANLDKGKTKYAEYIRYLWPTYVTDIDKKQEFYDKTKQPVSEVIKEVKMPFSEDELMARRLSDCYDAHFVRTGRKRESCSGCCFDDIEESDEEEDMEFPKYHIRDQGQASQRIIKTYLATRHRPLRENGEEESDPEEDEGHKLVEKIWNNLASKLPCDDLISLLMDRSVICEKPTVAALRAAKKGQKLRIKDVAEANSQQKQIDIMQKCSEFLLHRRAIESGIEDRFRGKIREEPDWNDPQIDEIKARLILVHPGEVTDMKSITEELEATFSEERKNRIPTSEEKKMESKLILDIMWKRFKRYEKSMKMYLMGRVYFPEYCTVDEESCRCIHCTMKYKYPPTPESLGIKKKR
ncbi:unnamed protein product [Auanema sp. JU1783]|nr:unnamed protein product [Auanema sp. JU1783]